MVIPIKNSSDEALEVQLEPWLDIVLLEPGETANLVGNSEESLKEISLEFDVRGCLLLHVSEAAKLYKVI